MIAPVVLDPIPGRLRQGLSKLPKGIELEKLRHVDRVRRDVALGRNALNRRPLEPARAEFQNLGGKRECRDVVSKEGNCPTRDAPRSLHQTR